MDVASTRPKAYRPRIVDAQIERYLTLFGAIEIYGAKWCGKTWSSLAHANSVTYIDRGANLSISQADPSYPLVGEKPHVVDEWQRVPTIWDAVRHAVDAAANAPGGWILTGSSTPRQDQTTHSGAGRIGRVRMHPMTLTESEESNARVSLAGLFDGNFSPCQCPTGIAQLAEIACRGGWPATIERSSADAQTVARDYLAAFHGQSIPQLGGKELVSRRLCLALARSLGQLVTNATLARDVYAHDDSSPSDTELREIASHLDLLVRSYLVDEVPGWVPASRSPKRMRLRPRRYFADPSLPVALLGLSAESLLQDWQTFGMVFENLCMRDLDVYARALPDSPAHPLRYYHDDSDLEVDAIVERADGSWGAFEIKLSEQKVPEAAANLIRLRDKLMRDSLGRTPKPSFLAVLLGTGEAAYRRQDGVYVIPIRALGA